MLDCIRINFLVVVDHYVHMKIGSSRYNKKPFFLQEMDEPEKDKNDVVLTDIKYDQEAL